MHIGEWFVGPMVAVLMALPIAILMFKEERKAIPVVLVNAIALGFVISWIKYGTQEIVRVFLTPSCF